MTDVLLEREAAMQTLRAAVATTVRGAGRLALVTGEAGQGKTALLRHFAGELPSGTLLLESGCDPLTTPSPLAPLHEIAPRLGLTADDFTHLDPGALFASTLELLIEHGPCVWIIEDVHWADGATLDLIRFVGRRIDRTSTLLVLTFRSDELAPDHPVRVVLGDLSRAPSVDRIELAPMSIDAVRVLCGDVDADEVHAVTRGNAFFVTEIAAGRGGAIPASVRDAVLARVTRLPVGVRRVVDAVSIAPRSMSFEVASVLAGADADLIGRAAGGGMLIADADGLRFRHELARRTIEQSIAVPTRRRLHLRLLDLLVAEGFDDRTRLAHHAVRSGDRARIVEFCPPAAREAAARRAYVQASELMAAALRHRRAMTTDELVRNLALFVESLCEANRAADALDPANDLLDVAERSGDAALLTTALIAAGRQRYASGDAGAARSIADRAIDAAERRDDDTLIATALVNRAQLSMLARRRFGAVTLIERALELAGDADDRVLARALNCLGCVELGMGGDVDRGLRLLVRSLAIGEELQDAAIISHALVNLGTGAGEVRRYDEATAWLERAIEFSEARDADFTALYARAWRDRVRFERGEWDLVDASLATDRSTDSDLLNASHASWTLTREGTRGRLAVRRGAPGAASALRELVDGAQGVDLQHLWAPLCGIAEAEWLAGRPEQGRLLLESPFEQALATDSPWAQGELGWWLWRCGGDVTPTAADRTPYDHHRRGDWEAAADQWAEIGCPYEEALARADGPTENRLRALTTFDRLGAIPAASWLRRRLRDDGVTSIPRGPRQSTLDDPAGLTRRQAEVLALAADGLTNAEIAGRLFLSPKTVEHHMSAVLSKLGVSSRRDAIAKAATLAD